MGKLPTVFIVTWCQNRDFLYGSTLVFSTLRVGFPDARVIVVDNGSKPEPRAFVLEQAVAAGCETRVLTRSVPHGKLVERLALESDGPCVFVDPDIVFWENVQSWDFGPCLMAGRYIPAMEIGGLRMTPRLHTSHLWIPDPAALKAKIREVRRGHPRCPNLFEYRTDPSTGLYWDTASALYFALGPQAMAFSEAQLDAYDHLFVGSDLSHARSSSIDPDVIAHLEDWHARARSDYRTLRGVWREQEKMFRSSPWDAAGGGLDPSVEWLVPPPPPAGPVRKLVRRLRNTLV
jgi:hypothetical protein